MKTMVGSKYDLSVIWWWFKKVSNLLVIGGNIALTSLFESVFQLEDPFVGSRLDCIDVESELRDEFLVELIDLRDYYFPNAPAFEIDVEIPAPAKSPEIRLFRAWRTLIGLVLYFEKE